MKTIYNKYMLHALVQISDYTATINEINPNHMQPFLVFALDEHRYSILVRDVIWSDWFVQLLKQ